MSVMPSPMAGRGLVLCGLLVLTLATTLPADQIAWVRGCVVTGGLLCAIGVRLICGPRARRDQHLLTEQHTGVPGALEQPSNRDDLEQYQRDVTEALQQQFDLLEQRQRALSERRIQFQEWMEYPQASGDHTVAPTNRSIDETQADRQVLEILHSESQRVFTAILDREYVRDDRVDAKRIRDDLLDMANRIASVYQPEHDNPLLSANLEQLLRASSRASLHLLIVIEQLPWNAEQRSLESLYSYISSAVSAYGVYKKAEPFLGFLNQSFYVGRFLAGSNPLTLGTWWLAGQLGKQGGQALARKYAQRQAIAFIHEFLRVVGYEVAGIYGGDFRHRDPNWIYGVELTQLVNRASLSRGSLRRALEEVSRLELRNEYDRLYLYRCLAQRTNPGLDLWDTSLLSTEERASTLERLEQFYHSWVVENENPPDADWQADVEERFQMQLNIDRNPTQREASSSELQTAAARSLLAFSRSLLGQSPEDAWNQLTNTRIWQDMSETRRTDLLALNSESDALDFVPPAIQPSHPLVDVFLEDLLQIATAPDAIHNALEDLLTDVAAYYRRPASQIQERLAAAFVARFRDRWPDCTGTKDIPAPWVPAFLQMRHDAERPLFVHHRITLEFPKSASSDNPQSSDTLALWGTNQRLMLLELQAGDQPLWSATQHVQIEQRRGIFLHDCVIAGGQWLGFNPPSPAPTAIVIPGTIGRSYADSFGDLIAWSSNADRL
ncbi:MAG: hypothetical protein ABGZ17_28060 [Planctomycetaceae bacterium]